MPRVHLRPVLSLLRSPLAITSHLDARQLHLVRIKMQLGGLVVDLDVCGRVLDPRYSVMPFDMTDLYMRLSLLKRQS